MNPTVELLYEQGRYNDAFTVERHELLIGNSDRTAEEEAEFRELDAAVRLLFPKSYPTPENKWFKVREKDDWGNIQVFLGKTPFRYERKTIKIQFPDGHEEVVKFYWAFVTTNVSDHGQNSSASSPVPFVLLNIHGLLVETRLGESKLKVAI